MPNALSSLSAPLSGTGLLTAKPSAIVIGPGANDGYIYLKDAARDAFFTARTAHVTADTSWAPVPAAVRNTTLATDPPAQHAATVEHLMAALAGLDVWDASIDLAGVELPILDGSALPFADAIRPLLVTTDRAPAPLVLTRRVEVSHGPATIVAEPLAPGEQPSFTYELDFGPASPLAPRRATWNGSATDFLHGIAPARTYSFEHEAAAARAAGLFAHLSPRDMLVIDRDGRPIDNDWRLPDEPARHKLLDLIGDLALLGRPLHARVTAHRSGHALAHQFCRAVLTKSA